MKCFVLGFDVFLLIFMFVLGCQIDIYFYLLLILISKPVKTLNQLKFCLVCELIPWQQQISGFQVLINVQIPKMKISSLLPIFFLHFMLILGPKITPVCYFSITFL